MSAENKSESARSRHAGVLAATSMSMSLLTSMGEVVEDGVDVAGDRQLLGGLGPGTQEALAAGAGGPEG